MNTIKDLLQKIFEHDYEMTISKNKNHLISLKLKKDLGSGYRIEHELEITPEFINSTEPNYTGHAVSDMFDKIIEHEKSKVNDRITPNT